MSIALARQPPYPVRVQQRRCAKCGKHVSRRAYACRRCGKAQRMRPRAILLMLSGVLLAGMFAFAALSATGSQARSLEPPVPALGVPRVARPTAGVSEIAASDLWSAYSRDRIGTERLYRDRSLIVTGTIRSIDRNYEGDMVVRLATADALDTVNATLATRNDPAVAGLAKGRNVSLLCVGRGEMMGAPLLGSCFVR